jgi:hypothetical protein
MKKTKEYKCYLQDIKAVKELVKLYKKYRNSEIETTITNIGDELLTVVPDELVFKVHRALDTPRYRGKKGYKLYKKQVHQDKSLGY